MADARETRPLVVRKSSHYYEADTAHHTCKPYRGDGITSRTHPKTEERKIKWRAAVVLK